LNGAFWMGKAINLIDERVALIEEKYDAFEEGYNKAYAGTVDVTEKWVAQEQKFPKEWESLASRYNSLHEFAVASDSENKRLR
mgnify:CR=1